MENPNRNEKIHLNPKFMVSSLAAIPKVHVNPRFVSHSESFPSYQNTNGIKSINSNVFQTREHKLCDSYIQQRSIAIPPLQDTQSHSSLNTLSRGSTDPIVSSIPPATAQSFSQPNSYSCGPCNTLLSEASSQGNLVDAKNDTFTNSNLSRDNWSKYCHSTSASCKAGNSNNTTTSISYSSSNYYVNPNFKRATSEGSEFIATVRCGNAVAIVTENLDNNVQANTEFRIEAYESHPVDQQVSRYYLNPKFINKNKLVAIKERQDENKLCMQQSLVNSRIDSSEKLSIQQQKCLSIPFSQALNESCLDKSLQDPSYNSVTSSSIDTKSSSSPLPASKVMSAENRKHIAKSISGDTNHFRTTENRTQTIKPTYSLINPRNINEIKPFNAKKSQPCTSQFPQKCQSQADLVRQFKYSLKQQRTSPLKGILISPNSFKKKNTKTVWIAKNSNHVAKKVIQKPIVLLTRNKIIRKGSNNPFSNGKKSPSILPHPNRIAQTMKLKTKGSPNSNNPKYSVITRNKLVRSGVGFTFQNPGQEQYQILSKNNLCAKRFVGYKKLKAYGSKVNGISSSNSGTLLLNKSDHFVKIGQAMYKSTATTLKRQIIKNSSNISRDSSIKRNSSNSSSSGAAVYCGKRWHAGTSWNRCWSGASSTVFPSLTSLKLNNKTKPISMNTSSVSNYSIKNVATLAHVRKVQNLQRIIIAAKQRSVLLLKRKAQKMSNAPNPHHNACGISSSVAISQQNCKQNLLTTDHNSKSTNVKRKDSYCLFYHRFGVCSLKSKCPFIHNPDRVAICTRFLRGRCRVVGCPFAHTLDKGRMPVCSHFLQGGFCTRENCPYLHVNPNRNAPICEDFLHGHCDKRELCKLQHVLECAEYRETGRCPRKDKCPLPHPKHRRADKTSSAGKLSFSSTYTSRYKKTSRKKSLSLSRDNDEDFLGCTTQAVKKKTFKKSAPPSRYFGNDDNVSEETETRPKDSFTPIADLNLKKERIMNLVEKLKTRPGYNKIRSNSGALASTSGGPAPKYGKYKIVDDKDVIPVLPRVEYVSEETLPSFIPLCFSP